MQTLQKCIGPTIRIGRDLRCLPYAGFLFWKMEFATFVLLECNYLVCLSSFLFRFVEDNFTLINGSADQTLTFLLLHLTIKDW